jgi:hypothetical protein
VKTVPKGQDSAPVKWRRFATRTSNESSVKCYMTSESAEAPDAAVQSW